MSKYKRPIITDPNINIPGTTMKERLKKYAEEKQEYARIREEERLNEYCIIDVFFNCIDKINNAFSKQKTK